jgi:hypothetical protein
LNTLGGGTLVFPASATKYILASTITLYPNVTIRLEGCTLRFTGGATSCFQFVGVSEAQSLNGRIIGIGTIESSTAATGYGVRLRNFSNFTIGQGIVITNFRVAVKADWGIGLTIEQKCTATTNTRGVETGGNDTLPAAIAAGIRGGTFAASPFMDSVRIIDSGFSQNEIDINDMGSENSLGNIEISGNTFFESSITPIAAKSTFVRIAGRNGIVHRGNWYEAQVAARSCVRLNTFDYDGTSRGAPGGLSTGGNFLFVQGGNVASVGYAIDRCTSGGPDGDTFLWVNAVGGYGINHQDPTTAGKFGSNSYLTRSGGGYTANVLQATDYNLFSDANNFTRGTATPTLQFGGVSTGITYAASSQNCVFTRNGNLIDGFIYMILTSKGAQTGAATIVLTSLAGAPLPAATNTPGNNGAGGNFTYFSGFAAGITSPPFANIAVATATLTLFKTGGAGVGTAMADTDFTNTTGMYIRFSYYASNV